MSVQDEVAAPHEVVIVRRRVGLEDEGHHGGAWKIAFADLMTAMMTFFLVMWLLNVSDQEKITRIATYFNPTKLSDKLPTNRGLHEVKLEDEPRGADPESKVKPEDPANTAAAAQKVAHARDGVESEGDPKQAEEELFNDPYGVLARMALKALERGEKSNGGKRDGEETLPAGDAFRNPFEPYQAENPLDPGGVPPKPEVEPGKAAEATPPQDASEISQGMPPMVLEGDGNEKQQANEAEVRNLETEIKSAVSDLGPGDKPNIEVARVDEGLLVSLTDDFRFGMFAVSSATPKPEVVVVMEKVAKVLAERPGTVVVSGHTDGRPFRSGKNDNWRLSMARAQVAYYMLVRGGLDEKRVERIEGHADRSLKIPEDPNAAQNRRIEILLKVGAP